MEIFIIICIAVAVVMFVASMGIHVKNANQYGIEKMRKEILGHRFLEGMFLFSSLALAGFAVYEVSLFGNLLCLIYIIYFAAMHIIISRRVWFLRRSITRRQKAHFMHPEYVE